MLLGIHQCDEIYTLNRPWSTRNSNGLCFDPIGLHSDEFVAVGITNDSQRDSCET